MKTSKRKLNFQGFAGGIWVIIPVNWCVIAISEWEKRGRGKSSIDSALQSNSIAFQTLLFFHSQFMQV
jgi:hypothetical protein